MTWVAGGRWQVAGRWSAARRLSSVVCGLLLLALAGCGGDSSAPEIAGEAAMHRANPARTGVYETAALDSYEAVKWQFETGEWIFAAPAVLDDSVYAASNNGNVYALDRETGEERWRFATGGAILASPAAAGDLVYAASMDGNVYALDAATGEERWRVALGSDDPDTPGGFTGSPAIVEDTLYVANESGVLAALDAQTGEERWRFQKSKTQVASEQPASWPIAFSPAIADGAVYVPVSDGILYVLDAATGEEQWQYDPAATPAGGQPEVYSPTADPVVAGDTVYFMTSSAGSLQGVLFAISLESHQARWQYRTPTENYSAPSISDGVLIWGSLDRALYAVSAETGEAAWTFPTEDINFSSPAIAGDLVYVGSVDKNLYALDVTSGEQRWQFRAGSSVSSPAVADGVVYVGTEAGTLFALE